MQPMMTLQTRMVLTAFLKDPDAELYGREISQMLELGTGTIYPILERLQRAGWLASRMEENGMSSRQNGRKRGRPPRRYYHLTSDGWSAAQEAALRGNAHETA